MKSGFTLIEILIVVGIVAVLASMVITAVRDVRIDAVNTRIINDIRQLRVLAESAYDASAATYEGWSAKDDIQTEMAEVKADLTDAHGDAAGPAYVIIDSEKKEFCASAPFHASTGGYYCVDQTGVFKTTTANCPTVAPIACP